MSSAPVVWGLGGGVLVYSTFNRIEPGQVDAKICALLCSEEAQVVLNDLRSHHRSPCFVGVALSKPAKDIAKSPCLVQCGLVPRQVCGSGQDEVVSPRWSRSD